MRRCLLMLVLAVIFLPLFALANEGTEANAIRWSVYPDNAAAGDTVTLTLMPINGGTIDSMEFTPSLIAPDGETILAAYRTFGHYGGGGAGQGVQETLTLADGGTLSIRVTGSVTRDRIKTTFKTTILYPVSGSASTDGIRLDFQTDPVVAHAGDTVKVTITPKGGTPPYHIFISEGKYGLAGSSVDYISQTGEPVEFELTMNDGFFNVYNSAMKRSGGFITPFSFGRNGSGTTWSSLFFSASGVRGEAPSVAQGFNLTVMMYDGHNPTRYHMPYSMNERDERFSFEYHGTSKMTAWQYNENFHYKECTECGKRFDQAAHDFSSGDSCTVCGFAKPTPTPSPTPTPTPSPVPTPNFPLIPVAEATATPGPTPYTEASVSDTPDSVIIHAYPGSIVRLGIYCAVVEDWMKYMYGSTYGAVAVSFPSGSFVCTGVEDGFGNYSVSTYKGNDTVAVKNWIADAGRIGTVILKVSENTPEGSYAFRTYIANSSSGSSFRITADAVKIEEMPVPEPTLSPAVISSWKLDRLLSDGILFYHEALGMMDVRMNLMENHMAAIVITDDRNNRQQTLQGEVNESDTAISATPYTLAKREGEWLMEADNTVFYLIPASSDYTENPGIAGDVNDDGTIDTLDAMLVLQYDCGWNVTVNTDRADMNDDGAVNIKDTLLILQHSMPK